MMDEIIILQNYLCNLRRYEEAFAGEEISNGYQGWCATVRYHGNNIEKLFQMKDVLDEALEKNKQEQYRYHVQNS